MKKKNIVLIIIIILLILTIIGTLTFIIIKNINESNSENAIKQMTSGATLDSAEPDDGQDSKTATDITKPSINVKKQNNPIQFKSLTAKNEDIYAWIYIPDTNVNYPICQSATDDNFYLNHDVNKNYSFPGSIYSQYCNKTDFSDRVTVLYGHNMRNGSMFATLHKFSDTSFFNSHPYMYVYTNNRKLTYNIVSSFVYDDRHIMNSFDFKNDTVFQSYLDMILKPHSISSNVRKDVDLDINDKILTLSTCLNSGEGRYLVQGVLIKDEQTN